MTIGDRIRIARTKQNMSQTFLAQKIGVSKQTLYKYENNIVTNIPSDKIELLSSIFGVSASYLMGWDEIKFSSTAAMLDVELTNQNDRIKEYMLKFAKLPTNVQEHIIDLIDMFENKDK